MKTATIAITGIILLSFIVGIYFYPQMPAQMASHWGTTGEVNGYVPKFWGLFLMPIISVLLLALFIAIPRIDPMKENIAKFRRYFDGFIVLIMSFLFYMDLITVFWSLGFRFNMVSMIAPALGILFYGAGMLIENSKRNWFIGIRTPWTLSNEHVWEKTQKLGGKLFKAAAVIAVLGIFFQQIAFYLVIVPILAVAVFTVVYSYAIYPKGK